jgi:hypothetical protein
MNGERMSLSDKIGVIAVVIMTLLIIGISLANWLGWLS